MPCRPFIYVLAGVNGAGKSSIGGALLKEHGLTWYNPDLAARVAMQEIGLSREEANSVAWKMGAAFFRRAIESGENYAFETTLGGTTIPDLLRQASKTHDVRIWYCGLESVEMHIERVAFRVACGGHTIPEQKIRERWVQSRLNLVQLIPFLTSLQVFDNSRTVKPLTGAPNPRLILEWSAGRVMTPDPGASAAMSAVPEWAKPLVQAAIEAVGS